MRKTISIVVFTTAMLIPATTQAKSYGDELVMPWQFYRRLSKCEVNLNVHAESKNYTGMYGIAKGTWARWSNSSSARGKDPIEQARVVDNIAWMGHTTDGVYKWPAGPWGWGSIRKNCMNLQGFICRSHHKAVARWKRNC